MCEGDVGLYDGSQVDILETVDALRDVGSGRLNRNIFVPVNYEIPYNTNDSADTAGK